MSSRRGRILGKRSNGRLLVATGHPGATNLNWPPACGPAETNAVPKRTYQPKRIPRRRRHGFLNRMSTPGGRNVIRARRLKGRKRLVVVK